MPQTCNKLKMPERLPDNSRMHNSSTIFAKFLDICKPIADMPVKTRAEAPQESGARLSRKIRAPIILVGTTFSNMITKEILKKLKDKYLKFFISGQLSWTTFKHLIQILFRAELDINQKSRWYQFFYAVNFAEHFADGHEKEVANICNLLIMNVDPEGHDPTTFGL